jgi:glucose/arabinose dehydrogenase
MFVTEKGGISGDMAFGPDGYLYIAFGDGGVDHQNPIAGLITSGLLGSILRIDVDGGLPYIVPNDNPFLDDPAIPDEVWMKGFRNPWRFSFDRQTDDIFIGDVGEKTWEEINFGQHGIDGGLDFGWPCYEAYDIFEAGSCSGDYTFPIYAERHPRMRAIIGGYVYRGSTYPDIFGKYIFADFHIGSIKGIVMDGDDWQVAITGGNTSGGIVSFGEGPDGELYLVEFGHVRKVITKKVVVTPSLYLPGVWQT